MQLNNALGKRKRNDNPKRHVPMNYKLIQDNVSVGVCKNGNAEKQDEFTIGFATKDTEYRLSLTRKEALRVVKMWLETGNLDLVNE